MPIRPSHWETTTFFRPADLLIIGAGLTGLHAARLAKQQAPHLDILVVERAPIPRGASTRNAGFACFGAPTELLADAQAYGWEQVAETVRQRYAGIQLLEQEYGKRGIHWHAHGGYELLDDEATEAYVREQLPTLNKVLADSTGRAATWSFTDPKHGLHGTLLYNPLEAQLHPGRLVEQLLADCRDLGVRFLFGWPVNHLKTISANTVQARGADGINLTARRALVTVNAFARDLLPAEFPEAIRPVRNQVLLSRPLPGLDLRGCYHYHEGYVYFRNVGPDRLLIGGGRHRAGAASETDVFGSNAVPETYLLEKLRQWFPERSWTEADFPTRWSGILAQGAGGKGPVLRYANDNVLVAGRLAGMGVALSASLARRAVGRLLC